MTVIGPLTTTFRAPSSCTTNTPQIYQIRTADQSSYVQGPLFKPGSDCYPSGYDASPSAYYSPGFCPHGYTAACKKTALATGGVTNTADAVETALICCPTGISYTCLGSGTQASMGCTTAYSGAKAVIGARVVSDGTIGSYQVFTETEGGFAAHSIQVRFRGPDETQVPFGINAISQSTSSSMTSATSGVQSATITATFSVPSATTTPATQPQTETKTEGVSTGAAIGIAIGSAIAGVLAVSIIGLFFFLRWRRKRQGPPVPPKETTTTAASFYTQNNNPHPPYELAEESTRRSHSRRLRLMSSRRTRPSTRGGPPPIPQARPAELEAVVPSDSSNISSFIDRSTLESSNSGWTTRQQRAGVMPTPWI